MSTWLGIRRAILMALAWAVVWAPLGVLVGIIVDRDGSMDEPWIAVGAYPGFLCGLVFAAVLGGRRLDELSLSRAGVWGAVSGLIVIVLPFTGVVGTPNTAHAFWRWRVMIIAAVTLLSAISAVGSVLLARMAKKRALRDGGADVV